MAIKKIFWLKIANHWDYLQRKSIEFHLLTTFKIRKFISLELLTAAK